MAKKPRPRTVIYRQKPSHELSIEKLEKLAKYLGYSLVCYPGNTDLYDCRNGMVTARGDIALSYLRQVYVEHQLENEIGGINS